MGIEPFTVIPLHHVRQGAARTLIAGALAAPNAIVVQRRDAPEEPIACGDDAMAIWEMLRALAGWTCIEVRASAAPGLLQLLSLHFAEVRTRVDVYYALTSASSLLEPARPSLESRMLGARDLPLLERAPRELWLHGFGSNAGALTEGAAAGSIAGGELVAIAEADAFAGSYADVGVHTLPLYRRHGLSSTVSWLVMRELCARGLTPIWSTAESNHASRRVAEKLGLSEVYRSVYLIPTLPAITAVSPSIAHG
jgi:hypothetical protein